MGHFQKLSRPMGCNGIFQKFFVPLDGILFKNFSSHGRGWDYPIPRGALYCTSEVQKLAFSSLENLRFFRGTSLNRQSERVYAVSRLEAGEQQDINQKAKYPKRVIMWLGASKSGLKSPIIFKPGETLSYENYIEIVRPHAQSEGQRLLGDDFIYQEDNATPHIHQELLA
jgi:hypothetical protein